MMHRVTTCAEVTAGLLVVAVSFGGLSSSCFCEDVDAVLGALKSDDMQVREMAVENFRKERKKRISELLGYLEDVSKPSRRGVGDRRKLAITLLGELRAEEAIDRLIELIDFPADQSGRSEDFSIQYPGVTAIALIGASATEKVVREIKRTSPFRIQLLVASLVKMHRGEGALDILMREVKKTTDKSEIEKLRSSFVYLTKYKDTFENWTDSNRKILDVLGRLGSGRVEDERVDK